MNKTEKESVQTAIRLPRETYDWLKTRPEGITDSIKRGLEFVALEEKADQPTRDFALLAFELAHDVELELGHKWHEDAGAHRVFRRMLVRAISKWRPSGYNDNLLDQVAVTPFQTRPHATQPINDADQLGVALADEVLRLPEREARTRLRAAMEDTLKEIVKVQQTRGEKGNG